MHTTYKSTQVITAATETTTSPSVAIEHACKVSFIFKRSNHAAGSSTFTVEVCPENDNVADADSTWIAYNRLITNATNTNAQTITRVASVALSSDTTSIVSMSPEDTFGKVRVVATEGTDGTHDAWILKQEIY